MMEHFRQAVGCTKRAKTNPKTRVRLQLSPREWELLAEILDLLHAILSGKLDAQPTPFFEISEESGDVFGHLSQALIEAAAIPGVPTLSISSPRDTDLVSVDFERREMRTIWIGWKAICLLLEQQEKFPNNEFPYDDLPAKKDWPVFMENLAEVAGKCPRNRADAA